MKIQLPSLEEILYKKVKPFHGQMGLNDIHFFHTHILSGDFIIPEYQRKDVWSKEQKENLIRSLFYGISIPPIILNKRKKIDENDYSMEFKYFVVDGGQRLRTLEQFFKDELVVDGMKWGTMHKAFQAKFLLIPLQTIRTTFKDEEEEKMYYYLFNTSGTNHTQEDIDKVL